MADIELRGIGAPMEMAGYPLVSETPPTIDLAAIGSGMSPAEKYEAERIAEVERRLGLQNQQSGLVTLGQGYDPGPRPSIVSPPEQSESQSFSAMPARPAPAPARRGVGGFRGVLGKEEKRRQGELADAQSQLDKALAGYDEATSRVVDVQQRGLEAEARGAQAQADAIEATRRQVADQQMLDDGERLIEQDAIEARQAEIAQGYERLQKEMGQVGDRRTMGERTMATVAVALGALGDALGAFSGRENPRSAERIQQLIQQQVDRDVTQQLRVLETKRDGLSRQERALKDFLGTVGDARAQRRFLMAQKWEELGMVSQQIAQSTTSNVKRNAAEQLSAMASEQSEAAKVQGAQAVAEDAAQRVRAVRDLGFELQLKQSLGGGKNGGPAAHGLRQIAEGTPEDAKKAQEIASSTAGILGTLRQLRDMASRGTTLSPTERQTAARRLASVSAQFNGVFGDGTAPNEAQIEQMKDVFLNPTNVNLAEAKSFYDQFLADGEALANAQMRPYGFALDSIDTQPYRGK